MRKPFGGHTRRFFTHLVLFSILVACSKSPEAPGEKTAESSSSPQPVTARFAFQRTLLQARTWAPDAQLLRIYNVNLREVSSVAGKCGGWSATFVSAQLKKARTYSFSVVRSPGYAHEGVFPERDEPWSGSSGQARPFPYQALKVDSDEAYATAAKESTVFMKKHPHMLVQFLLEYTPRYPDPAWRVIWGENLGSSKYSVFVDCITGKYLQTTN
jgi:hypothetical protein